MRRKFLKKVRVKPSSDSFGSGSQLPVPKTSISLPFVSLHNLNHLKSRKNQNEVFIVGGGSSLADFNFSSLANKDTIVVNSAFLDTPNPNYFVTVDYTFLGKRSPCIFQQLKALKVFVADFSSGALDESKGWIIDKHYGLIYNLSDFDYVIKSQSANGIGWDFNNFVTGKNSGFCALQLAILLGYKEIYLLGFDLCSQKTTHYHKGYGEDPVYFNEKLKKYLDYFKTGLVEIKAKSDIKVFSCSSISSLNEIIPFKDIKEIL